MQGARHPSTLNKQDRFNLICAQRGQYFSCDDGRCIRVTYISQRGQQTGSIGSKRCPLFNEFVNIKAVLAKKEKKEKRNFL